MDEQLRVILIIVVSVSIFGLLVFVFVKNVIRNRIESLVEEEDKEKRLKYSNYFHIVSLVNIHNSFGCFKIKTISC